MQGPGPSRQNRLTAAGPFAILCELSRSGRLAQWESASLTPKRSLVQIQYCPFSPHHARLILCLA